MNSCLSYCHQRPVPTEPCGINPSQHLGQPTPLPQVSDTIKGAFSSRSSATTHVHPAPSPLLCQHCLCRHTLSQMVGLIQLEACLSVKGRGLCPSQAGLAAQLTRQVCMGACTCTLAPATCPSNKWLQAPSKPEQQEFPCSLHYCKLLLALHYSRGKSAP